MAVGERDPHTGHLTTGHEWNGIKELNTPVPRVGLFLPARDDAFRRRLLGADAGLAARRDLHQGPARHRPARDRRASREAGGASIARRWTDAASRRRASPTIQADPRSDGDRARRPAARCSATIARPATAAMRQAGRAFPTSPRASWLWGGDPETIAETIRVGINSGASRTRRSSQMLAFGRDEMLTARRDRRTSSPTCSLSDAGRSGSAGGKVEAGKAVFAANCAACHGEDGKGKTDVGAPDLTDAFWIYGGDPQSIFTTVCGRPARAHADLGSAGCRRSSARSSRSTSSTCEAAQAMSAAPPRRTRRTPARGIGCWSLRRARLLVGAPTAHLVYVAMTSQPDCVAHLRPRRGGGQRARSARRKSACSPRMSASMKACDDVTRQSRRAAAGREDSWQPPSARRRGVPAGSRRAGAICWMQPAQASPMASCVFLVSRGHRRRPVLLRLGLHPVSGARGLHGRRPDPRHRALREEPADRGRRTGRLAADDLRPGRRPAARSCSPASCSAC